MNPVDAPAPAVPPTVPSLVARLIAQSPARVRQKLVTCLLGVAGPLALASLADGRFARLLVRPASQSLAVTLEEEMFVAADELRFEYAAKLRDEIRDLRRELAAMA